MAVAWAASWRLIVTATGLVGGTSGCVACVLLTAGLSLSDALPLLLVGPALGSSIFLHEAGHVAAYVFLCPSRDGTYASTGIGTFRSAGVVRWSLGAEADAVIALVGPSCGLLPVIALLVLPGPHLFGYPLILLFSFHLASLAPTAADGAQFAAFRSQMTSRKKFTS